MTGTHVMGKRAVAFAQHPGVVFESREDVPGAPARIDREARGECQCTLFEPLDAQQFIAKWFVGENRT